MSGNQTNYHACIIYLVNQTTLEQLSTCRFRLVVVVVVVVIVWLHNLHITHSCIYSTCTVSLVNVLVMYSTSIYSWGCSCQGET